MSERLATLTTAIDTVCGLAEELARLAHAHGVVSEDIADIARQVDKLRTSIALVVRHVGADDRAAAGAELHRLNNHLTGVVSLGSLCRDEMSVAAIVANLAHLDSTARGAAAAGRALAVHEIKPPPS